MTARWLGGARGCVPARKTHDGTWGLLLVFEDEAGFSLTPPQVKTWFKCGRTPVVRVRGRSRRRVSIAALKPTTSPATTYGARESGARDRNSS